MKLLTIVLTITLVMFFQISHAQWTNPDPGHTSRAMQCFVTLDTAILAGTETGLLCSANNGATWTNYGGIMGGKNIRTLFSLTSYPFNVLGGTVNYGAGGVFQSTNYGESWTGFPLDSVQPPSLAHVNSILKTETSSEFWVGTDKGMYLLPQYYPLSSWIPFNSGLPSAETKVRALLYANGEIFAGTESGVYILNGSTWDQMNNGLTNTNVTALKSTGGYLIAGTSQGSVGGVYISSDTGKTWIFSLSVSSVTSILTIGSNIFVGSFGDGIWLTKNHGTNWNQVNDGLSSSAYYVLSLGADDQFLFDGTNAASIWRRPLSQMITVSTAVQETSIHPEVFSLQQNYPNPFNPSTSISFTVGTHSHTSLRVYDMLGREVATIFSGELSAGSYTKQWNAVGFSSGVYFYQLQTGLFTQTKKLIVLK
jgi:ligand-binding sensor domain-containing protein